MLRHAAVLVLLSGGAASAQPTPADGEGDGGEDRAERLSDDKNWVNLRVGGSTGDQTDKPFICLEVDVVWGLSVEGCGTGAGILHSDGGELAHFRGKWTALDRKTGLGRVRAQLGLGFAELQLGDDDPGFVFGSPDGGESAAGPEGSAAVQLLTHLGSGFELVSSVTGGIAYIGGADQLAVPQDERQLSISFEIGLGF